MTTEQKAKAYDEAKARMSRAYNSNRCTIGFMNEIFPELKESNDEKIRKWLIDTLKGYHHLFEEGGVTKEDMLSWLEKQGEQKHTDNDMVEALRTEYEKGRADVIAQMQEEWSEKDEKILKEIISDVKFEGYNNDMQANSYKKINWLKSIKDRVQSQPKQEWSEEDEKMIKKIMHILSLDGRISNEELKDMFDWLKSLRLLKE